MFEVQKVFRSPLSPSVAGPHPCWGQSKMNILNSQDLGSKRKINPYLQVSKSSWEARTWLVKQTSKKESENESMAQAVKSLKARPSKLATNPASTFRTSCPSLSDSDRFVSQFRDVEGAFFFCVGDCHTVVPFLMVSRLLQLLGCLLCQIHFNKLWASAWMSVSAQTCFKRFKFTMQQVSTLNPRASKFAMQLVNITWTLAPEYSPGLKISPVWKQLRLQILLAVEHRPRLTRVRDVNVGMEFIRNPTKKS